MKANKVSVLPSPASKQLTLARVSLWLTLLLHLGCAVPNDSNGAKAPKASAPAGRQQPLTPRAPDSVYQYEWARETASPRLIEPLAETRELARQCIKFDEGLMLAARAIAENKLAVERDPSSEELNFALRAAGVPQVWPRVWSLAGSHLDGSEVAARAQKWLEGDTAPGERRCGLGTARLGAEQVVVLVTVHAIAELAGIPTQVRVGEWARVDARMLQPTSQVEVIVLGPTGKPFRVPRTFAKGRLKSTVRLDRPGKWLIQVLATLESGPRPALETIVFVAQDPETNYVSRAAPGELEALPQLTPEQALSAMVNGARSSDGLRKLKRDAKLDRLAREHAIAMQESRQVAHNVGSGDPFERIMRAGLEPQIAGENVASARDAVAAHRALWSSPSHRGNILDARFDSFGVGVSVDSNGTFWVCELFANFARTGIATAPEE